MDKITVPLQINLIVLEKHGIPAIELRTLTTNKEIIQELVTSAFHGRNIILKPVFTNTIQSTNSLISKGVLFRGEDGKLYFHD
jgi:hypothetical protein